MTAVGVLLILVCEKFKLKQSFHAAVKRHAFGLVDYW